MKTLLAIAIAAVATLAATTNQAEAGPRGRHHHHNSCTRVVYTSCGCPIYQERYIAYRDCYGYPVYRYRTVSTRHSCRPVRPRVQPCYDQGYRGGYYGGGAHYRSPGVVISARF